MGILKVDQRHRPVSCGIDISIRGTGLAISQNSKVIATYKFKQVSRKKEKGYEVFRDSEIIDFIYLDEHETKTSFDRAIAVSDYIKKLLLYYGVERCSIEGAAINKRNSKVYSIGEFSGIIKAMLKRTLGGFKEVPPATLKKVSTGNGQASKEDMMHNLRIKFKFDCKGDDDVADAALLSLLF